MFIDSHAHLFDEQFGADLPDVLDRAKKAGIDAIIVPSTNLETAELAIELAGRHPGLYSCVGVHPHEAANANDHVLRHIEVMSDSPSVVAIGEVGLDYYYDYCPKEKQKEVFEAQLRIAVRRDLPVVVHTRESMNDAIEEVEKIVRTFPHWREQFRSPHSHLPPPRGVFHCFTGTVEEAWRLYEMGFSVSYPGIVTFKNSPVVAVLKEFGYDHILLETDSPYLSPVPLRGKRNEPANIAIIASTIADVFNVSVDDVARAARYNTKRLFRVGPPEEPKISYTIRNSLYLNITNRCSADCVFCERQGEAVVKGHNLKLEREPTAEDLIKAIADPARYSEVVFCGYGEPTVRLDVLLSVAEWIHSKCGKVRLNTNGHGNIIHGRNIVPELAGVLDAVSISLNATDAKRYGAMMRVDGERYFASMKGFARECVARLPKVLMTIVDRQDIDVRKAKDLVEKEIGATFVVRPYF